MLWWQKCSLRHPSMSHKSSVWQTPTFRKAFCAALTSHSNFNLWLQLPGALLISLLRWPLIKTPPGSDRTNSFLVTVCPSVESERLTRFLFYAPSQFIYLKEMRRRPQQWLCDLVARSRLEIFGGCDMNISASHEDLLHAAKATFGELTAKVRTNV